MNVAHITDAFMAFRTWFIRIGRLLFDTLQVELGGFKVSFGGIILTGILISLVLSVFLKGAKQ